MKKYALAGASSRVIDMFCVPIKEEYHDIDKVIEMYNDYWNYPTSKLVNFHKNNLMDQLAPLKRRPDFIRYDMFKEGHDLDAVTERIIDKCFAMNL